MTHTRHPWSEQFRQWWRAPVTAKDRWVGAWVGAFAWFWLGFLALAGLGVWGQLATLSMGWALAGALLWVLGGGCLGYRFPKPATVVLFPFAAMGGGA